LRAKEGQEGNELGVVPAKEKASCSCLGGTGLGGKSEVGNTKRSSFSGGELTPQKRDKKKDRGMDAGKEREGKNLPKS